MGDDVWSTFPLDPRDRANAALRASYQDRERITAVLSSAFADGRLERDELEERLADVAAARTLGELPPLVADLVPLKSPPARFSASLVTVSSEQMHQQAVERWADQRRNAVFLLFWASILTWGVWFATGADYAYIAWPAIISGLSLLRVARVSTSRDQIVRDEVRRLEKKQARQQRWPRSLS